MAIHLKKKLIKVNGRGEGLNLSSDGDAVVGCPDAIPKSPTDGIISPCSQKLCVMASAHPGTSALGHQLVKLQKMKKKPRKWESVEVSVEEPGIDNSLSDESSRSSDEEMEIESEQQQLCCHEGIMPAACQEREKRTFFNAGGELNVTPRPNPCPELPIVLGSSSTKRRLIMEKLEWKFAVMTPGIDEKSIRHDSPSEMCRQIASAKASALVGLVEKPALLITADQVCVFEGDVREKPSSVEEAQKFLGSYSRKAVRTLSAVCVTNVETGFKAEGVDWATVRWREIDTDTVEAVVANGSTMSSAGGFAIEDPDLAPLVEGVDGSVDSVYGLPVDLLCRLMVEASSR